MKCPHCSGPSKTIYSRAHSTYRTRRRTCLSCNEKFTTKEILYLTIDTRSRKKREREVAHQPNPVPPLSLRKAAPKLIRPIYKVG